MVSASGILPAAKETERDTSSAPESCRQLAEDAGSVILILVSDGAAEDDLRVGRGSAAEARFAIAIGSTL
jgi:hypothetical protein